MEGWQALDVRGSGAGLASDAAGDEPRARAATVGLSEELRRADWVVDGSLILEDPLRPSLVVPRQFLIEVHDTTGRDTEVQPPAGPYRWSTRTEATPSTCLKASSRTALLLPLTSRKRA